MQEHNITGKYFEILNVLLSFLEYMEKNTAVGTGSSPNMEFRQFAGSLDGLAFLPLADVRRGMAHLILRTLQGSGNYFLSNACNYFDDRI